MYELSVFNLFFLPGTAVDADVPAAAAAAAADRAAHRSDLLAGVL